VQLSDVKLGKTNSLPGDAGYGPVQTLAVISGKGGAGKTNIAVNLALALAREGRHTALLDADPGTADVKTLLDLDTGFTLMDVLEGKHQLRDIIIKGPDNLLIVPAASGIRQLSGLGTAESASLVRAFSEFNHPLDMLIIDTASETSTSITSLCGAASEILVIAANEPPSLNHTIALIRRLYSEYAIARFHILANRVHNAREGNELFAKILDLLADEHNVAVSYAGFIPQDEALSLAAAHHRAVIDACPRSRSAMALRNLATRIACWPRPQHPRGHLEFFVERLLRQNNVEMEVLL